jgi:hypothetical protein
MGDTNQATIRRLLDRLLAARARRDREVRFSDPWRAADSDMHELEAAIFRVPLDPPRHIAKRGPRPLARRAALSAD